MLKSLRVVLLLSLFTIICRANAQTTQPMPSPSGQHLAGTQPIATPSDAENLKEKARQARAACNLAKRRAMAKLEQTDDYKQAIDDLKSAQQELADSNVERTQAANDVLKARQHIQKLTDTALAADPEVVSDTQKVTEADAAYQAAEKIVEAQAAAEGERERAAAIEASFKDVTFQQLKLVGVQYASKPVKMADITFRDASNDEVGELPGVTILNNGLQAQVSETLVDRAAFEKWVGFSATDSDGHTFDYLYADKPTYGNLIADLKSGKHLSIRGFVVHLGHAGLYGIVCTKITVLDDAPRGYLGVRVQPVEGQRWLLVMDVIPNSPASRAGLSPGDQILTLAGEPVGDVANFTAAVANHAGKTEIVFLRDGQRQTITVDLQTQ